jgi:serine/threonine protein kinase
LAFGELPIDKKSTPEVALFHLIPQYVWTGKKPRNVSSVAFEILKKCLNKNPHERFLGFGEIESKLLRIQKSKKSHVQPAKRKPIVPKTNNWKRIFLTVFFIFLFTGLLAWNYVDILFPGDSMPLARCY